MLIFLDTEFTDFFDPALISIGMVADSGAEFYAEVPYPEHGCKVNIYGAHMRSKSLLRWRKKFQA